MARHSLLVGSPRCSGSCLCATPVHPAGPPRRPCRAGADVPRRRPDDRQPHRPDDLGGVMSTITITETEETTQTGDAEHAHIVKSSPGENANAKVLSARVLGTPIEALCGFVWVPCKDPTHLPVCPKCKDIYDTYRAVNDGLNERPSQ